MNKHKSQVSLQSFRVHRLPTQQLWLVVLMVSVSAMLLTAFLRANATDGQYIANNTPAYVSSAKNLGAVDASQEIEVSLWLQPHNRSALDALAHNLYNPSSPSYRHWLKTSDIAAQFAPTASEAKTVQEFLESNNLKVLRVGPNNFYVRAQGTIASVENTFHVQINNYQVGSQTLRSNASDPYIEGPAAALVQAVSGLDNGSFQRSTDLQSTALSLPSTSSSPASNQNGLTHAAASASDASWFNANCFTGPETQNYTTAGGYPKATYKGNVYYTNSAGCGYSPSNIYAAYNLNGLYAEGYTGAGQTIVIMDWCGSPTILDDTNTFSERFGLPKLTASNFQVINYPGPSDCSGVYSGIQLEVEWAHAIAPGANIDLIIAADGSYEDVDEATYYAATYGLGNVISGGYTTPELQVSSAEANKENLISEIAAVEGVATNYADPEWFGGFRQSFLNVGVPADLPYATGVGGVSLALNSDNSIAFQTAWEMWHGLLDISGQIDYPPSVRIAGPATGVSGGPSIYFAKPWFQTGVPGKQRQQPDISWLADPLTGVVVVVSNPTQLPPQTWFVTGGTGLSTPMFSALWAIANEEAGTPLGQAAPYLYSMPSTTIADIVPYGSANNVTETVEQSSSVTYHYNARETIGVQPSAFFSKFYSVIWNYYPGNEDYAIALSFGGDTEFYATVGWDDVTGLGTPTDAKAFADWFAPAPQK